MMWTSSPRILSIPVWKRFATLAVLYATSCIFSSRTMLVAALPYPVDDRQQQPSPSSSRQPPFPDQVLSVETSPTPNRLPWQSQVTFNTNVHAESDVARSRVLADRRRREQVETTSCCLCNKCSQPPAELGDIIMEPIGLTCNVIARSMADRTFGPAAGTPSCDFMTQTYKLSCCGDESTIDSDPTSLQPTVQPTSSPTDRPSAPPSAKPGAVTTAQPSNGHLRGTATDDDDDNKKNGDGGGYKVNDDGIPFCCLCSYCGEAASGRGDKLLMPVSRTCDELAVLMADPSNNSLKGSPECRDLQDTYSQTCCDPTFQV